MNRRILIACAVVLLHLAALWALQSGMLRRAVEVVVPAQVLSEFLSEPQRTAPTPPTPSAVTPTPRPQPRPLSPPPLQPAPAPVATTPLATASTAPAASPAAAPAAPAATAAAVPSPTPAAAAAPARVELPSSDAAYLNNPKPAYPMMSKRLGEQGKVVVRVLIGADGAPQQAELRTSSGYERLDQAALTTVLRWRYTPGKRGGVAEAMWFNVPINFVLE